jgi:hypothetical protein
MKERFKYKILNILNKLEAKNENYGGIIDFHHRLQIMKKLNKWEKNCHYPKICSRPIARNDQGILVMKFQKY